MSKQGNPTGIQRKLQNIGVAVHKSMEKWESLNASGHSVINSIANRKLEQLFGEGKEERGDSEEGALSIGDSVTHNVVDLELEKLCEKLHEICSSMEEIVEQLNAQCTAAQGLRTLSHHVDGDSSVDSTRTVSQLDGLLEAMVQLCGMCKKEQSLKQKVAKTVVHAGSRELLMTHCSIWINQPYLNSKILLESVLFMTGHSLPS